MDTKAMEKDTEFEDMAADKVVDDGDYWDISSGSRCFCLAKKHGVEPKAGDTLRVYGQFGFPIRGVTVNGRVAFYRTLVEQAELHSQENAKAQAAKVVDYEHNKERYEQEIVALPEAFKARIARFRKNNPSFCWEMMPYELFCCREAVKIADALRSEEAIDRFHAASCEQQRQALPGLDYSEHSGNTFGAACFLARAYISCPENVDKIHGTLCPLLGCKECGCYSTECQQVSDDETPAA